MNEPSSSSSSSSRSGGRSRGGGGGGNRRRRSGQDRASGPGGSGDYRASSGGDNPGASTEKPSIFQRVASFLTGMVKKPDAAGSSSAGGSSRGDGAAPNANRNGYGRVPAGDDSSGGGGRPARAPREREREPRNSDRGTGDSTGSGRERPSRKPESVEVSTPRLYVGNLSFDTTESDLTELFNGVGRVVSAEVVTHRQTQRSKGFAFVQMAGVDEAKRAVEQLHEKEFMGRKLFLSGAKSTEAHDGRDEPRFAS